MDLQLANQVVIITGGASGIGRTTAEYFRREGSRLVLGDAQAEALAAAVTELRAAGAEVVGETVDVRDYAACQRLVARAADTFGRVDVLVNSAGIGGPTMFFAETIPADWQDLIAINLVGVMHCCRAVTDRMIAQHSGRIINLASEAGKGNEKRIVVYGATKGGVITLTRGLAVELGRHGITVNAVCPGVTRTPMTSYITDEMEREWARMYPLGRLGRPEDIAPLITFLASPQASWITGQAISVSGGFGRS
ncbi:MAG: SDR family oxidoreductase [Deltaproteobacteria bacterium]|nr:SDR family oxidoreductase [Deltaproteobacteria bacterium]